MKHHLLEKYIVHDNTYLLEPNKNFEKDFLFWFTLYIKIKCEKLSNRGVKEENRNTLKSLIQSLDNCTDFTKFREIVNHLARIEFKSPQTYYNNIYTLYSALKKLDAKSLKDIQNPVIRYIFDEVLKNHASATKQNKKTAILNFIKFIEKKNIGDGSGGYLFKLDSDSFNTYIKKSKVELSVLTPEKEYIQYLHAIDTYDFKKDHIRNRLILKLLILTGMRISEALDLKYKDIIDEKKRLCITVIGKGDKKRKLFVEKSDINSVWKTHILSKTSEDDYLFLTAKGKQLYREYVSGLITKLLKYTNIKVSKESPHMLRHSFACYAYYTGTLSLNEVQEQLGHEDSKTTHIYLHYLEEHSKKASIKLSKKIKQDIKSVKRV